MNRKILYKISPYLLLFSSFSIGFSSWSIANNSSVYGNISAEKNGTLNVIQNINVETFQISTAGLISDETIVNECSVVFTFSIDNNYIQSDIINYQMTLVIGGIDSSIENYCINDFVKVNNSTVYNKLTPFPIYDSNLKQQIYRQDIIVNKDIESLSTIFTISFTFNGNFFNILNNDLSLKIMLVGE